MSSDYVEIDYAPLPHQQEFHDCPARFRLVLGGRRSGKTHSALQELFRHALEVNGANAWWVSPTLSDAREVGWEPAQGIIEDIKAGDAKVRTNQSRMRVSFGNGSVITFKGAESEKALRGRKVSFVVIDEAAFVLQIIWRKCIRPTLSDLRGRAVLCSTPNGFNWLQQEWEAAPRRAAWARFHWPTWVNPTISPEELDDAKASLSDTEWRQEFCAEFVTRGGQVYPDFGDACIIDPFNPSRSDDNIYLGVDPGYAGAAAVCFMAVPKALDNRCDNKDTVVRQFAELYLQRRDVEQVVSEIHRVLIRHGLQPKDVRKVYTDPAANTAESTSGISPANIIKNAGKYQVENRPSLIAPGLALVRTFMLSADGRRRFFVARNCAETIRSLRGYSYATGRGDVIKEDPVKDGAHDHAADAVRYFFVNKFEPNSDVNRFLRMAQM